MFFVSCSFTVTFWKAFWPSINRSTVHDPYYALTYSVYSVVIKIHLNTLTFTILLVQYNTIRKFIMHTRSQALSRNRRSGSSLHREVVVTFYVRHSRGKMYIGQGHLCVCVSVCLSVPRCIRTLLHGPGCNLGERQGVTPSCALLGGFAISVPVSLL